MLAVIDYNVGNLFSVKNALDYIGEPAEITNDPEVIRKADGMILPGVGAFPDAMRQLEKSGLVELIREQAAEKPLLGICLGMQMLFQKSYEFEECPGLSLIRGKVDAIPASEGRKIPHMGWNSLHFLSPGPLLDGVPEGSFVYFVHSYMAFADACCVCADVDYGVRIPALVRRGNVFGAQFHPEKSGETGLRILKNFGRCCGC